MKKLTFLMLILCSFVVANAEQISKNQAAAIAGKYLPSIKSETAQPMKKAVGVNQSAPEYYIFNAEDGKGFVIVSGDDELTEVVAYSTTGSFRVSEDMPAGIKNYLNNYSVYVKAVRSGQANPLKREVAVATPVVEPLVTTKWNQMAPYNTFAPFDRYANANCPIGCVATAFAQLMKYYEWPAKGMGSKSYRSNYGTHSVNFANSVYDWSNMIDEYNSYMSPNGETVNEYTQEQGLAVGKLMWDCAVSVGMQFMADASGALEQDVLLAAAKYFQYNTQILYRDGTIKTQFLDAIKNRIDQKHPVMFCGQGIMGGHAYVCDGYDSNDFLHVNWGWSGMSDGYFSVDLMNPEDLGTGGGAGGFTENQSILTLTPNTTGSEGKEGQMPLTLLDESYGEDGYFKTDATSFKKGETFTVKGYKLINTHSNTKTWSVSAGIFDKDGKGVALASNSEKVSNLPSYYMSGKTFTFDLTEAVKGLSDGSYFVKYLCKEERTSDKFDWIYVVTKHYVTITVSGENVTVGELPKTIEMTTSITSDSPEYLMGEKATFRATFKNNSEFTSMGSVKFLITDADTGSKKKTFTENLTISAGGTTELQFTLDIVSPFAVDKRFKIAYYSYTPTKGNHTMSAYPEDNGCVISVVEKKGGIGEIEADGVSVYPNPASDYVKVNAEAEIVAIELYNAGGGLVKKVAGTDEISVSDCPAGYYLVNVVTEKGSIRKSVIVK